MKPRKRTVDEARPCEICGTIEDGLYFESESLIYTKEAKEWLCEKCQKEKYPDAQRIQ
jgi:hypothetical protein